MAPQTSGARERRIQRLGFDYAAQPKRDVSVCNLCGAQQFVVLSYRDRYGFPAQGCGCMRCGLVFLHPVMTAEAYKHFYARTYRPLVSAYHGRRIDARTIQTEQRVYAKQKVGFLDPHLARRQQQTLLDIGGSTGIMAQTLSSRFGLRATVLDPAPLEIAEARALGIEAIPALLEEFDPQGRQFDVVTMCQTVDHLLDVSGALEKVSRLLHREGLLYLDIVDFRAAYLRAWNVEEAIKVDHPYYLTDVTMNTYLARTGFEVLRMEYAPDHLHVGYLCRKGQADPESTPPPAVVARQWTEVRMVQNTPRGR